MNVCSYEKCKHFAPQSKHMLATAELNSIMGWTAFDKSTLIQLRLSKEVALSKVDMDGE